MGAIGYACVIIPAFRCAVAKLQVVRLSESFIRYACQIGHSRSSGVGKKRAQRQRTHEE